jgi:hypothetical protein
MVASSVSHVAGRRFITPRHVTYEELRQVRFQFEPVTRNEREKERLYPTRNERFGADYGP